MKLKALLFSLLFLFATMSSFSQVLTFKVQTVTYGGSFANKGHVLAIWITDVNGNFVKTIDRHATSEVKNLTTWITASAKNVVDATTGSTLKSHPSTAVTYTWNCTDVNKAVVPDGKYNVKVEFTEQNDAGKIATYPFTIGPAAQGTFTDLANFKSASYSITQSTQTAINVQKADLKYEVIYLSSLKTIQVKYDVQMHERVSASIFDTKGREMARQNLTNGVGQIATTSLAKGTYIVKLTDNKGYNETKKIVVR